MEKNPNRQQDALKIIGNIVLGKQKKKSDQQTWGLGFREDITYFLSFFPIFNCCNVTLGCHVKCDDGSLFL